MITILVDKDKLAEAKERVGDRTPFLIAELLGLQEFDEHSLKSLCPFHEENTPSFIYNPKTYSFHCFGCGRNASLLDAYMENGFTFLDSAEKLFDEAGIMYSFGEKGVKTHRNYRYPNEVPVRQRTKVDEYMAQRKISKETLDHCDVREDENHNAVFNYYDSNDVLTMVKYRPARKIDKASGEPKCWCQKGADTKPLLFNMNRINTSAPLLICEGECDCMAAIESGYKNSVSIPLGAKNTHWIEENWEWLSQFNEIIICSDNDEPGVKMATDVCPRLGSWRTKVVNIPYSVVDNNTGETKRIKDLNELLFYCGKNAVLEAILNATETPIDSVMDLSDVKDINICDIDGIYFGLDDLDKELFKLFFGTLTLVTGRPGCVSGDTEFYDGSKWKRIDEYEEGDMVLQYCENGSIQMVKPERYHKYECASFWHIYTMDGYVDQMVSDEHNMVYVDSSGRLVKKNVMDFISLYSKRYSMLAKNEFDGKFIVGRSTKYTNGYLEFVERSAKRLYFKFIPAEPGSYKYCFTVPSGMLVLKHNRGVNVTGNSGKTSFLYQLVCNALEQRRGAWIFSRELPDYMSRSWLNFLLAGPRHVSEEKNSYGAVYYSVDRQTKKEISECYRGQWYVYKNEWPNDVDSIKESMEASARKYGSKFFLLDNLMTIDLRSNDDNKYDKQTEFINWLIQFSSRFNVCVVLVAHPRKMQNVAEAVDLYDISGSSNLVNLAHRTLSLRRVTKQEKANPEAEFSDFSCVVSVTKDRMRGRAGFEMGLHYDNACRRFFTDYSEFDKKYRWDTRQYKDRVDCHVLDGSFDEQAEVFGICEKDRGENA